MPTQPSQIRSFIYGIDVYFLSAFNKFIVINFLYISSIKFQFRVEKFFRSYFVDNDI